MCKLILENKKAMKTRKKHIKFFGLSTILLSLAVISCERDISDEAVLASFPNTPDVFTDNPVGLTDEFFESFDPAEGYDTESFDVVDDEAFEGTSSIRLDVPAPVPGTFQVGGIFRDRGNGRNLTQYDALTFYAKASTTGGTINIGFGSDFGEERYRVERAGIALTTNWRKYVIPIPDASKLIQEVGLFSFFAGPINGDTGWIFWLDEIRYETLGTNLVVGAEILNGQDLQQQLFSDADFPITGTSVTFNLATGENVLISATPFYFNYDSSNPSVAEVNENAEVILNSDSGTSLITASIQGVLASGSIEVTAAGDFPHAPVPTRPAANVVSLFSDAYTNVPVRHYNGFFAPYQTTQGGAGADPNNVDVQVPFANGTLDNIINYTQLNFVSIGTYETVPLVDASSATHLHIDINVRETVDPGDFIRLEIESGTFTGSTSGGSLTLNSTALSNVNEDGWLTLDIPLANFSGSIDFSAVGQLFFISDGTVSNIWVDNVYFYNE